MASKASLASGAKTQALASAKRARELAVTPSMHPSALSSVKPSRMTASAARLRSRGRAANRCSRLVRSDGSNFSPSDPSQLPGNADRRE